MSRKTSDSIASGLSQLGKTLKSLCKMLLSSRPASLRPRPQDGREIYILGNGPSLKTALQEQQVRLAASDCLAVNFFANSPAFSEIKPRYYILIDPHFFTPGNANGDSLWRNLAEADWDITLIIPVGKKPLKTSSRMTVKTINAIGLEGYQWFTNMAYTRRWGMPRPRNVLIAAIMAAAWAGYKRLVILGADHSWTATLSVADDNTVLSVQPHFYKEAASEQARQAQVYKDIRLHTILESFAIAFRAYHDIQRWAQHSGVQIVNATPGSFIDAFQRQPL